MLLKLKKSIKSINLDSFGCSQILPKLKYLVNTVIIEVFPNPTKIKKPFKSLKSKLSPNAT
jgi:hypothetical protein